MHIIMLIVVVILVVCSIAYAIHDMTSKESD
jgi:hypothetical protein